MNLECSCNINVHSTATQPCSTMISKYDWLYFSIYIRIKSRLSCKRKTQDPLQNHL